MADHAFATALASAEPEQLLTLEQNAGHSDRFSDVDALAADLIAAALAGHKIADIRRAPKGARDADALTLAPLTDQQRAYLDRTFALPAQQARGAWFLPEQARLKAGSMNLPAYLRHHPWHAITLATDDISRIQLSSTADSVLAWSMLIPLFDRLLTPIVERAAGSTEPPEQQQAAWIDLLKSYQGLGIDAGPVIWTFTYRGGWSRLDRAGQVRTRVELLDTLAGNNLSQLAARFRAERVRVLADAVLEKSRRGTPLARRALTKALHPILAAYFAGDWLAFLNYLDVPPNPNEELASSLPKPKLYVSGASKATSVASEHGLDVDEVHAMLAAFIGQDTPVSPVERRVEVLNRWWSQFDAIHARQTAGMPTLWGLVDEGAYVDTEQGPTAPVYHRLLTPDIISEIDHLWDGATLSRWPETIVSEPFPHKLMAEALGPAATFWHGVALTAWYICEGPYSRTPLEGLRNYYQASLTALGESGTPIHTSLFYELEQAERFLGPPQHLESDAYEIELPNGTVAIRFSGGGQRRDGFETLRDIITRHRKGWTKRYLAEYLQHRYTHELNAVARELHRHTIVKGKPPTFRQFARFAALAANHWFNGDLASLYTAIGETAPATPRRIDLLPTTARDFIHSVYVALGGKYHSSDLRITDSSAADHFHQLARLASASVTYVQVAEALGRPPVPTEFGANRYEWDWAGGQDTGWSRYQRAIDQVRHKS